MLNEVDFVIVGALQEASSLHQTYIGSEHLLLAILKNEKWHITQLLNRCGMFYPQVRADIVELNYYYGSYPQAKGYSSAVDYLLKHAYSTSSLILEMLNQKDSLAFCLLERYEISIENVMN